MSTDIKNDEYKKLYYMNTQQLKKYIKKHKIIFHYDYEHEAGVLYKAITPLGNELCGIEYYVEYEGIDTPYNKLNHIYVMGCGLWEPRK